MNSGDKKSILLVEDELLIAMTEKKELEKFGYSAYHVATGEKAVEIIIENSLLVDLILMDINLGSGMDGTQAAEQILSHRDIPVVFLSSHAEPEIVERTEKISSYGYVVKNSGIFVLVASIKMAMKLFNAKVQSKKELTERLRVENKLHAEREQLFSVFNSIDEAIYVSDPITYELLYVNKFLQKLLPPNHIGSKCYKILQNLDAPCSFCTNHIILKQKPDPYNWEFYNKNLDKFYAIVDRIIHWSDGRDVRFEMAIDITKHKRAEAAIRESEQKLQRFIQNMRASVVVHAPDSRIVLANEQACTLLGLSVDEIMGKTIVDGNWSFFHEDTTVMKKEESPVQRVINTHKPVHNCVMGVKRVVTNDLVWLLVNADPEFDSIGQLCQIVAVFIDITELKKAEKENKKLLTEKEILVREIHHRVKNNIFNIESLLLIQADSSNNPEVSAALQDAGFRVQSMRILYEKMLISKDLRNISMKNYIEDIINSLYDVSVDKKNITIEKNIAEFSIASKQAMTIGIIINELLTNALKYAFKKGDNGLVSINIQKINNTVTLIIHDNGIGIEINKHNMENKSSGFGLTIVKMLVEQLSGNCTIVNDNGTKTIVSFEI
ncbi:MAG: response regulator [Spirochaetales bacterium]|nr:response regulator [Spirochaetales bacterium]